MSRFPAVFIEMLLIMSVVSDLIFGIVFLISAVYRLKHVEYIYLMLKIVLVVYAVPVLVFIYLAVTDNLSYKVVEFPGDDGLRAIYVQRYGIEQLQSGYLIVRVLFGVWISGAIISFCHSFIQGKMMLKKLIGDAEKVITEKTRIFVKKLGKELNIKRIPDLYKSSHINAPFLTGIAKPAIIFPDRQFSEEEWAMLLRHELTHLKAKDLLFKAFVGLVQNMYWFNPVVYFYKKTFFNCCEYACDKSVTKLFDLKQRSIYARLIVCLSAAKPEYKQAAALADANYKVIERRVREIMRVPKKGRSVLLIGMLAAFVILSPMVTYAAATGLMEFESEMIERELFKDVEIVHMVDRSVEVNEVLDRSAAVKGTLANPRGVSNIDVTISAQGRYIFDTLSLKKGQKVTFSLASDKSSDRFSASATNASGNGKKYFSEDGVVSGTYTIPSNGIYDIYMEGHNNSGNIHVTGMVRVE